MIERTRLADENHAVVTVRNPDGGYCRRPCPECPWRRDQVGTFPAEAFRLSAETGYDGSFRQFGCHMTTTEDPKTCAGFALRAHHNLALRFSMMAGRVGHIEEPGDGVLFDSYREMAVANGVSSTDPVLERCR